MCVDVLRRSPLKPVEKYCGVRTLRAQGFLIIPLDKCPNCLKFLSHNLLELHRIIKKTLLNLEKKNSDLFQRFKISLTVVMMNSTVHDRAIIIIL